ncbi:MAG: hypothetical protein ACR2JE_06865 [Acidobacteriaceae bacterium]
MKLNSIYCAGILALSLAATSAGHRASAQESASPSPTQDTSATQVSSIPLDRLVTATCRQAWQMGGRTQDGFFAIVKQLAELSAQNRGVTLPDNKAAGARAGEWIRTQALKGPDQLLYAVVDHAVQHSIAMGRAKSTAATPAQPSQQ